MPSNHLPPAPHHHLPRRPPNVHQLPRPRERNRIPPALERHQAVPAHPTRHLHIKQLRARRQRLQYLPLLLQGLPHRAPRHRTPQPIQQVLGLHVQQPAQLLDAPRTPPQNLPERLAQRPDRTLHLPFVRPLPRPAGVHPETTHPRIRRIRPVQHRRRARSSRYPRLQVVDPNPQRNAPIPPEQHVMPRVPRQLRLVLARPAELRPAIRQRPQQQRQLRPLRPDRNPILEPVVLRLNPRRRLHPTDRSQPRLPVLPPHMTHHRLVTPRIPVIPNQRLVNQTNLARQTLPKKTSVSQTLLDHLHDLLIPIHRRRLSRSTIQPAALPQALQPIPNRTLRNPQILRQPPHRRPPLTHPARHQNLVLRQLHALALRRTNGAPLLPWRPTRCVKVGVSQPTLYGRLLHGWERVRRLRWSGAASSALVSRSRAMPAGGPHREDSPAFPRRSAMLVDGRGHRPAPPVGNLHALT